MLDNEGRKIGREEKRKEQGVQGTLKMAGKRKRKRRARGSRKKRRRGAQRGRRRGIKGFKSSQHNLCIPAHMIE
eukprot:7709012-Karenia_brevis.AAC.1